MSTKDMAGASFRRALYMLVTILGLLCFVLFIVSLQQGPRLRRAHISPQRVTQEPGQRLVLVANQPLEKVASSQIHVTPQTAYTASVSGEELSLRFTGRLQYNTTYTVNVEQVSNRYHKHRTATFRYSFKTSSPNIYFLKRHVGIDSSARFASKQSDEIMRSDLQNGTATPVFTAEKIQSYVLLKDKLVVNTIESDDGETAVNSLYLVNLQTKKAEKLALPSKGQVTTLAASPGQGIIGYTFTSDGPYNQRKYQHTLFVRTVDGSDQDAHTHNGLDGQPVQTLEWLFARDGTLAVQTYSGLVLLVDPAGKNKPVPLGQFSGVGNFSYDNSKLEVDDVARGPGILNILTHDHTPLTTSPLTGPQTYTTSARLLANKEGLLKRVEQLGENGVTFAQYLIATDSKGDRILHTEKTASYRMGDYASSPNDQYATAEIYPADIGDPNDKYPETARQLGIVTRIIDLQNGKTIKQVDGFMLAWE